MSGISMDLVQALIAAVGALAGVVGVMWVALQKELTQAKAGCEEDRRKLWELVKQVSQLERRRDLFPHTAEGEHDVR
jgi:hypothetical protein